LPPYQPDAHPLLNTHSYRPAVRISAGKTSAGKYWHAEPPTLVAVPVSVAAASLVSTSLQSAIQQLKQDQASQQAVVVNNTAHKQTIEMETLSFSQRDLLLVGDTRGQTSIYDILTQRCLARKAMHNEQSVRKILWGGSLGLLSAGMDGKVVIADIEKLTYRALSGHTRGIHTLVNAPMHRLLVTAGFDHKILLFDPFISHNIGALPRIDTPVVDVMVNEMHNQIICVTQDKSIRIFDIRRPSQCMQVC
jgi:WD40 repeat protein